MVAWFSVRSGPSAHAWCPEPGAVHLVPFSGGRWEASGPACHQRPACPTGRTSPHAGRTPPCSGGRRDPSAWRLSGVWGELGTWPYLAVLVPGRLGTWPPRTRPPTSLGWRVPKTGHRRQVTSPPSRRGRPGRPGCLMLPGRSRWTARSSWSSPLTEFNHRSGESCERFTSCPRLVQAPTTPSCRTHRPPPQVRAQAKNAAPDPAWTQGTGRAPSRRGPAANSHFGQA